MARHQLGEFRFDRNPKSGDLRLMAIGPVRYKAVLARAFPNLSFSQWFHDRNNRFSWGTYIKNAGTQEEVALADLCALLRETWLLEDDLTETIALGLHQEPSPNGDLQRTAIGQLVFEAKSYNRVRHPGNQVKARELADRMAKVVERHPTYRHAQLIVAVPESNREKAYDLPNFLCRELSQRMCIPSPEGIVCKSRDSKPMKNLRTVREKIANVEGLYQADESQVRGKTVLLVDDIL